MSRLAVLSRASAALVALACGGGAAEQPAVRRVPPRQSAPVAPAPPPPKAMRSFEVARVPEGTFGPYIGRREDGAVVLWAAPEDQRRAWFGRGVDKRGKPTSPEFRIAEAPGDVGLVAVRGLGRNGSAGFVVLSTSREFSGERIDALAIGREGKLVAGPTPLVQSLPNVVWVDAIPTEHGALAFWAVKRSGRASLHVVSVGVGGDPRSAPVEVLSDARAWQVARVAGGAAVGVVRAGGTDAAGSVVVSFVDDEGALEGREVIVSKSPTAEADIDMISVKEHLVLAWSDRRFVDARLVSASVGPDGKVSRAPAPLTAPRGPQALLRLVPPSTVDTPAFAVWEDQLERPKSGRNIEVGTVDETGTLGPATATVRHGAEDGSVPEFAATSDGFAVLTLAAACHPNEPCDTDRVVPTFARLDRTMAVMSSEPVRLDALDGAVAELTWGLDCRGTECMALAALPTVPAPVFSVRLGGGEGTWLAAAAKNVPGPPPRISGIDVVGTADSLSDIGVAALGESKLVAWLSYFDPAIPYERPKKPAPDGRMAPVRAVLRVAIEDASKEPTVLSYRARSVGGVAVASDGGKRALVVWSALENGEPQVFLTLVGDKAQKIRQRMLTRAKGSVSHVAAARVPHGWIVAWVDGRHGGADVYAARLDEGLARIGPEQRLTDSAGNTSGVALLSRGEHVFVAWADARGHQAGVGDIFAGRLSAKDASLVGPSHRLTRTADNSHSPVLAGFGGGAVVGWLEESTDSRTARAHMMVRHLDSGAEPVADAEVVDVGGTILAFAFDCEEPICRVAALRSGGHGTDLVGFTHAPERDVEAVRLVGVETVPQDVVSPVVSGSSVYYGDVGAEGDARVRRVTLVWREPTAVGQPGP